MWTYSTAVTHRRGGARPPWPVQALARAHPVLGRRRRALGEEGLHARARRHEAGGVARAGGGEGDVRVVEREAVVAHVREPQLHHSRPPCAPRRAAR
jgi:hypothetical protein